MGDSADWRFVCFVFLNVGVTPGSIGLGFMSLGTDDRRIAKMAQQVKDVLPHVPLNVITKDLGTLTFGYHIYFLGIHFYVHSAPELFCHTFTL